MPAATLNLNIDQGATFSRKINFKTNGTPDDLTDRTFSGSIRARVGGPKLCDFTFIKSDQTASPGDVYLKLTAQDTALLPVQKGPPGDRVQTTYLYDVSQTYTDGTVEAALSGQVIVTPRV